MRKILKNIYFHTCRLCQICRYSVEGFIHSNHVVVNSYIPVRKAKLHLTNNNFGDDISMIIAEYVSNRKVINHQFSAASQLGRCVNHAVIGSIIPWILTPKTEIWGSGIGRTDIPLLVKPLKVHAVRGPLTRQYLLDAGIDCPEVYGDPALLLSRYYRPKVEKKYKIGFIPHLSDTAGGAMEILKKYNPEETTILSLDKYGHWTDFINQLCQCEIIVSSSLHGLILADAYGIPNIWVEFNWHSDESGLKFRDYFLGAGRTGLTEPMQFIEDIPLDVFKSISKTYTPIDFDAQKLLNACPFYHQTTSSK